MVLAIIRSMRNVFRAIVTSVLGVTFFSMSAAPALGEADPAGGPADKILILPFNGLNPSEYQAWLGRSIQQSVLADLTAVAPGRVASADIEARDANAALDAARKAGARFVVFGNFTTVDHELRLTGQVLDVSTGKPVTALKATGDVHDVFRLEDQVAAQIRQPLALGPAMQEPAPVANGPYPEPTSGPVTVQPAPPNDYYNTYVNPPSTAYYNNYYYDNPYPAYDYGGYGWGYPWFGLGFGFVGTPFFHHRFHDDGFRDRDGIRFHDFPSGGLRQRAFGSSPTVGSGVFQPGGLRIVPGGSGLRMQGAGFRSGGFGGGRMGGGGHFGGGARGGGGGHR